MNDVIYVFNGKDITMTVCLQIRAVVDILQEWLNIDFMEAIDLFYLSDTYQSMRDVRNGLWAESAEYIADQVLEETGRTAASV